MNPAHLSEPHHDGSALHVEPGTRSLGDVVAVRLRVPADRPVDRVAVRSTPDGEPRFHEARVERVDAHQTWWVAELPIADTVTPYRFLLETDAASGLSAVWVNAAGVHRHDVPDAADFRLTTHRPPPAWLDTTVGYQIFPDRFARSTSWNDRPPTPAWSRAAAWDEPVDQRGRTAVRQLYGGDLYGAAERLDHLVELGADLVYLTPFFPARSSHRYDATSFDTVDPLLGGDAALAAFCDAAHRRGIRVIGDLTLNHTGDGHDWFRRARDDASSAEADFYLFGDHPDDYVAWYDLPHLPKLDHRSAELRRRLIDGADSIVARWMESPYALDGWRIDCANTTARHGAVDLNALVARTTRATMLAQHPDPWLVAEHCYDATVDLTAGGWHGAMAYQWFTRPLVQWLGTADPLRTMSPRPLPRLDGRETSTAMRTLAAGAPWSSITASMNLLDSHDTPRLRSLVRGDARAHHTAIVALMTMPGVPTLFAGSEVGVTGDAMDSARVPFPWDRERWDRSTWSVTRDAIALRRSSPALRSGGLRWLPGDADHLRFVREHAEDRVAVELCRGDAVPGTVPDGATVLLDTGGARVIRW